MLGLAARLMQAAPSENAAAGAGNADTMQKPDESARLQNVFALPIAENSQGTANPLTSKGVPVNSPEAVSTKPNLVAIDIAPSQNATINLIRRLVKKGVLSEEDAKDLIEQAE